MIRSRWVFPLSGSIMSEHVIHISVPLRTLGLSLNIKRS